MGFEITSLQRNRGPVQARSRADAGRAVLKYIDVDDLVPSEDNFYSMTAIEELASLIELSGGVKQPALVTPLGGGKYKVIAGHRRRLASLQLVKQGKDAYRKMPCMVEDMGRRGEQDAEQKMAEAEMDAGSRADAEADELRAVDEAILLITTNGQRDKTDWDKVQEATRLRALLEQKRRFEKIPGETRKLIAERLGTTPAQVGRYDSIEKHLLPEFKALLETGKITISVAYELSTMTEEEQNDVLDGHGARGGLSIEDVKRWREKLRTPKPFTPERDEPGQAADGPKCKPGVYVREETAKNQITPSPPAPSTVENAGKIVNFPAPPSPTPAEDEQEEKDIAWAVLMMKTLHNYCEVMSAREGENRVPWADYAEALAIAIPAMRD